MNILLLQIEIQHSNVVANVKKIQAAIQAHWIDGRMLCITPELGLCGYPKEGVSITELATQCKHALQELAEIYRYGPALVVGGIEQCGLHIYNSAFLIQDGEVRCICRKEFLKEGPIVNEKAYFSSGEGFQEVEIYGCRYVFFIGSDSDNAAAVSSKFSECIADSSSSLPEIIVCLCLQPVIAYKYEEFEERIKKYAYFTQKNICIVNSVGYYNNWGFLGGSMFVKASGEVLFEPVLLQENVLCITQDAPPVVSARTTSEEQIIWNTVVYGIQNFMKSTGCSDVVIGLSGGIDSSVVAALAVDALGEKHVHGVLMPSPWSSPGSITDAEELANNLHIDTKIVPISPMMDSFSEVLEQHCKDGVCIDVAKENIQARIRGMLLMMFSNVFNWIVLATGNKSELAVGYCTLYGDMCGSLAPIGDLYKTDVYRLGYWYNRSKGSKGIPLGSLEKAPSAELREGQIDQDTLPPYDILDAVISSILKDKTSVVNDYDAYKNNVLSLMHKNMFKYKYAAPSLMLSEYPLSRYNTE